MNLNKYHIISRILLAIYFSLFISSCSSEKKGYILKGTIKNYKDFNYSGYIYLANENGIDSVEVIDEKFEFRGHLDKPTQSWIHLKLPYVSNYIFMENSIININGIFYEYESNGENFNVYQIDSITGSYSDQLIKGFQKFKIDNSKKEDYPVLLYDSLKKLISENPKSPVSGRLLSTVAIQSKKKLNYNQIDELYKLLDTTFQSKNELNVIKDGLKALKFNTINAEFIDFNLKDIDNNVVNQNVLKGKLTYVDFWASWCKPCIKKHPKMKEFLTKNENKDFQILGISIDKSKESWNQFLSNNKLPWINTLDEKHEIQNELGVNAIPFNYLIDKKGKILAINGSFEEIQKLINENQ